MDYQEGHFVVDPVNTLPNGVKLTFIIHLDKDQLPFKVLHGFKGDCPYCNKSVSKESPCTNHGCLNGDITDLYNRNRLTRFLK